LVGFDNKWGAVEGGFEVNGLGEVWLAGVALAGVKLVGVKLAGALHCIAKS
jgi:hypothetical protein